LAGLNTSFFVLKNNMKFILGKKMQMTQIWANDKVMAVTPVLAGPCTVTQVKTKETDSYEALQVAFGNRKEKNIKKPQLGHFKAAGVKPTKVRELRAEVKDAKVGDVITVATFEAGDTIDVTGTSKGKGFQGVVKRHHFAGGRKSHGNKDQLRMGGSVGAKGPAHIFKNTRMPGRMGNERVTVKNLEIVKIDEENNLLFVKGAIPGAINGFVIIKGQGELRFNIVAPIIEETPITEEIVNEEEKVEAPVEATSLTAEEIPAETVNEAVAEEVAPAEETK
jgi:large subunit ribosomal protein L3